MNVNKVRKDMSLTLTPTRDISFLDYLLGKGGVKKQGFPPGYEPGDLSHHKH